MYILLPEELNRTILTLFIIYVGGALFAMGRSWLFTLAGQRVVARLRKDLFQSLVRQDVAFFDTNRWVRSLNPVTLLYM